MRTRKTNFNTKVNETKDEMITFAHKDKKCV